MAASLHQGPSEGKPNGVLAVLSPSLSKAILFDRFNDNLETGYAKYYPYPTSKAQLSKWIDDAFENRESAEKRDLVKNGRRKLRRNLSPDQPVSRPVVQPSSTGGRNVNRAAATATATSSSRSVAPRRPYLSG